MLKVKPSRYNLVVETQADGAILLFNTFSTALCLLGRDVQHFLNEAQYVTAELSAASRAVLDQFISMGFIVDQSIDELMRLELRQNMARYNNHHLSLTIGPTTSCNMCCPYCFEAEGHHAMTSETAKNLIQFIKDYITVKKIESVSVIWYGGEPLLELSRIEQISNEIIPFCERENIPYSAGIITNGYCLERNSAKALSSLKVNFAQVTIDGLEETHNARRKLKSGTGSFWPIVKNIETVKDILPIVIRVNVDQANAQEIDALTDFFLDDMHWGKKPTFYLAPVEKCTDACSAYQDVCMPPKDFSLLYQKILAKMFEHGVTEIAQKNYPSYSEVGCAAICTNNFVIDANGYFYTCWNNFADPSKSIGYLDAPKKLASRETISPG